MLTIFETAGEELFTHQDETTGAITCFAVSRILTHCHQAQRERIIVPVEASWAKFFVENRGVERHRLQKCQADLIRGVKWWPLLMVEMPEPVSDRFPEGVSHLLIDGTHRYVTLALAGITEAPCWMLTEAEWRPFEVERPQDLSMDDVMKMPSGR